MMKKEVCPLCHTTSTPFKEYSKKTYFGCLNCGSIFLGRKFRLSIDEERERYDTHNNDVNDPGYQDYVMPLVDQIIAEHSFTDVGLDYGCGPGPVITNMLSHKGYEIKIYDPYYTPFDENLEQKYDFIILSEVAEHFHNPNKEFAFLKSLLNKKGVLYVKTQRYSADINFDHWYYKNDSTHVFFYREKTFSYIKEKYGFKELIIFPDFVQLKL